MRKVLLNSFLLVGFVSLTNLAFAQPRECNSEQQLGISGSDFFPIVAYNPSDDSAQILTVSNRAFANGDIIATSAGTDGVFGTGDDIIRQVTATGAQGAGKRLRAHDRGTVLFTQGDQLFRISAGPDALFGTSDDGAATLINSGYGHIRLVAINDNIVATFSDRAGTGGASTVRVIEGCDLTLAAGATGGCAPGNTITTTLQQNLSAIQIDRLVPERLGGAALVSVGLRISLGASNRLSTLGLRIPTGQVVDVGAAEAQVLGSDPAGNRLLLREVSSPLAVPANQTVIESRTAQGVVLPLHSGSIEIAATGTENDNFHAQRPYVYETSFVGGGFRTYMYDLFYQHAPIQIAANTTLTDISVGGPFVAYDRQGIVRVRRCR